ncbi:FecR family protein [Pedobacter gandavensis]|uniref:FecR family protein n=1 Tax=Pedobacter gandavensis TaxID=2679963 RepID=UPI00292F485C|nr:FecR family protein [Pedobacter gandavensis]
MYDSRENKRYQELAAKWLSRSISEDEAIEFANWYNRDQDQELEVPEHFAISEESHKKRMFKNIQQQIQPSPSRPILIRYRWAIAAILFISVSIGLLFYPILESQEPAQNFTKNDVSAGTNKAFLTLSDGTKLSLTDQKAGKLVEQAGVRISKGKDAQVIYTQMPGTSNKLEYHTISTPRAGQYQLNLPDGTKVWINAATVIRFPTSFSKSKERRVELIGEAYFEVAKDAIKPFIVKSAGQEIKVFGTHFNISSYPEDQSIYSTLLEGSISVNGYLLKPNQQSINNGKKITIVPANIENVMAWKMGYFRFDDASLEDIMKKIARWYDVEVEFQDTELKTLEFGGIVSRSEKLSKVLRMLELSTSMNFKLEDNKIIIMRKK